MRRRISRSVRQAVRDRDHNTCRYCGEPGTELDHIVPYRPRQWHQQVANLVVACTSCNRRKGKERGFHMEEGMLYYYQEKVCPSGLFGEALMQQVEASRRRRQVKRGLSWAVEMYGGECT